MIPGCILFGYVIILVLYLTNDYTYIKVICIEGLKGAKSIAAIIASKIFGINAERVLSGF